MSIIHKILHKTRDIYRHKIVYEQYPMLTSISRREWKAKDAIGIIYLLHHITEKSPKGIPTNEDLKVSPYFLEEIILKYKKQGFNFISLDEVYNIISSDEKQVNPFIAFTIDDGYLDNYTKAFPIFKRQEVPFTIFIATNFIDQKIILWWDILEDLVLHNDSIKFGNDVLLCKSFQDKWDIFRIIRERILCSDQNKLESTLIDFFSSYSIDWYEPIRRQAMSWDQVKDISTHPLCTIGGHTVSHLALNMLNDYNFRLEVSEGIEKLQASIGKPINHFAYPYGSPNEIGKREYDLISEFNFKTVFKAYGGCITEHNKHHRTQLPRVFLHE